MQYLQEGDFLAEIQLRSEVNRLFGLKGKLQAHGDGTVRIIFLGQSQG